MNFSIEELNDMLFILGECSRNCLLASRVYKERYPNRRAPRAVAMERLKTRFTTQNRIDYKAAAQTKPILDNENNHFDVLLSVTENPQVSATELSNQLNISRTSVGRILKSHGQHPYHPIKQQELLPQDYQCRVRFCKWAINMLHNDVHFFSKVMFTDESTFANIALPNRKNLHY